MPRVDEPVLGLVVERVREHPFLLRAGLERMRHQPVRGARQRVASGHEVAVAEVAAQSREVEHAMRGQWLRKERTGGHGKVVGHRDDLELVVERGRDDLHHLADAEHLLVADVEDLPGGGVGLLEREQERVREILGVPVMVQREAVVGDHDPTPTVEHAPHDEPLARHELVRPVHVRIAEVRGVGMDREERLLGARDAVPLLVLRRAPAPWARPRRSAPAIQGARRATGS